MEVLKYTIEDKTIALLLGKENFTNKESAVLELVKNAYDANSEKIKINFYENCIVIRDFGIGMNEEDIKRHWMHVGKSDKGYFLEQISNKHSGKRVINSKENKRVLAGSKGVGRFALARLGQRVQLITKKKDSPTYIWQSDWEITTLDLYDESFAGGTEIRIYDLNDRWNKSIIKKLSEFLSLTYNDNAMDIQLQYKEDDIIHIKKYFNKVELGKDCTNIISLHYDSERMELKCRIKSDEFSEEAKKYCKESINYKEEIINISHVFDNKEFDNDSENLCDILTDLGDFEAEIYFSLSNVLSADIEKFLYKHNSLSTEKSKSGIVLYRNAFSISSYEGKKDWLGLAKRARMSPAAATHITGSWRVRDNQVFGKVIIDKKENCKLQDMSNRQGLDENIYYEFFVSIIQEGITCFERYRQSIIRNIDVKNKPDRKKDSTLIEKIISNPKIINKLEPHDAVALVSEIGALQQEHKDFKKVMNTTEIRYKYDVRILNVLATLGLKAMSIAHELHNDRNKIDKNCENIISALVEYDLWDLLNSEENKKYTDKNVPDLIASNERINKKMVVFMDTMLEESEKEKFIAEDLEVKQVMKNLKDIWQYDYSWIEIVLAFNDEFSYKISEDIVNVIFDNLILNSIQQNEDMTHLEITITFSLEYSKLKVIYADNGEGLHAKYRNDPFKILEVHETSRRKGHGLGMWIVNNTLDMTGGKVLNIKGDNGFYIEFEIGEMVYE